jgi:hypothetical protein
MKQLLLASIVLSVVSAGCSSGRTINGQWSSSGSTAKLPPGATLVTTFSGSDKLTMAMDIPQEMPGGKKISLHADVDGTYKIEKDSMTVHADNVKFTGSGFPPELKPMLEANLAQMGEQAKETLNKEGVSKMAWVDNDHFTLTGSSGKPETFTRMK